MIQSTLLPPPLHTHTLNPPHPSPGSRYTIPGWVACVLVLVLLLMFGLLFRDPTEENDHLVKVR